MWKYEKRLQYPVKISQPNPKLAQFIISQYGGPDGEMGASMRYLSQRFAMPYKIAKGALTDIGTEELGHLAIICHLRRLKHQGLDLIILIIPQEFGRRRQAECLLMLVNFSQRETR